MPADTSTTPKPPDTFPSVEAWTNSPQFRQMWAEQHVASPATYLKIFRHPAHERMIMTTTSLGVLSIPGTRVVVYTPTDDACRDAITSLLTGAGTDRHFSCWPTHDWGPGQPPEVPAATALA